MELVYTMLNFGVREDHRSLHYHRRRLTAPHNLENRQKYQVIHLGLCLRYVVNMQWIANSI